MSNMSYCRFENTLGDFRDCAEVLEEMMNGETDDVLSRTELPCAQKLLNTALELIQRVSDEVGKSLDDLTEDDMKAFVTQLNQKAQENLEFR